MTFPALIAMGLAKTPLSQQFAILRQLGIRSIDTEQHELSDKACFFLWADGLLSRLSLPPEAVYTVMKRLLAHESDILAMLSPVTDESVYRIMITDKQYVTIETDREHILDIKTGLMVADLPDHPFESVIYDLVELFRRNAKQCQGKDDELGPDSSVAGGVGQS